MKSLLFCIADIDARFHCFATAAQRRSTLKSRWGGEYVRTRCSSLLLQARDHGQEHVRGAASAVHGVWVLIALSGRARSVLRSVSGRGSRAPSGAFWNTIEVSQVDAVFDRLVDGDRFVLVVRMVGLVGPGGAGSVLRCRRAASPW
jgi:hypothetical protein